MEQSSSSHEILNEVKFLAALVVQRNSEARGLLKANLQAEARIIQLLQQLTVHHDENEGHNITTTSASANISGDQQEGTQVDLEIGRVSPSFCSQQEPREKQEESERYRHDDDIVEKGSVDSSRGVLRKETHVDVNRTESIVSPQNRQPVGKHVQPASYLMRATQPQQASPIATAAPSQGAASGSKFSPTKQQRGSTVHAVLDETSEPRSNSAATSATIDGTLLAGALPPPLGSPNRHSIALQKSKELLQRYRAGGSIAQSHPPVEGAPAWRRASNNTNSQENTNIGVLYGRTINPAPRQQQQLRPRSADGSFDADRSYGSQHQHSLSHVTTTNVSTVSTTSSSTAAHLRPPARIGLELGNRRECRDSPDDADEDEDGGVHVVSVAAGSPAAHGGLEPDDVIYWWAGVPVATMSDVSLATRDAVAAAAAAKHNSVLLPYRIVRLVARKGGKSDKIVLDGNVKVDFKKNTG